MLNFGEVWVCYFPSQMSNENNPGWFDIGDYVTQLCGEYFINHEIRILELNNQYWDVHGT